jgi:hypothetical protein
MPTFRIEPISFARELFCLDPRAVTLFFLVETQDKNTWPFGQDTDRKPHHADCCSVTAVFRKTSIFCYPDRWLSFQSSLMFSSLVCCLMLLDCEDRDQKNCRSRTSRSKNVVLRTETETVVLVEQFKNLHPTLDSRSHDARHARKFSCMTFRHPPSNRDRRPYSHLCLYSDSTDTYNSVRPSFHNRP